MDKSRPDGLSFETLLLIIEINNYFKLKNKNNKKLYGISICAIFKDESIYLKEWIEFHLLIWIEHFYLYNNFSKDSYLEVLKPYIEKNIVTLRE